MGNRNIEDKNKITENLRQQITAGATTTVDTSGINVAQRTKFTVPSTSKAVTNANIGFGLALGTLPKCRLFIHAVQLDLAYVTDGTSSTAPDIGVGTVIGTGSEAALGTIGATTEDCLNGTTGTTLDDAVAKAYDYVGIGEVDEKDGSSTAKTLYLNFAGAWGAIYNFIYSGTVTVIWSAM